MPIPPVWRGEYRVNTSQFATNEFDAEIGALANGRFAMTWVSDDSVANDGDARFTIRLANGDALSASFDDEAMAANGAVDEFRVAVAGLSDGRTVYVWDEEAVGGGEKDVYAEVRNADGGTFTDRFEITNPSGVATDDQDVPTVLGLSNGNFMVAYRDTQPATDTIRVRPFDIAGVLQGGNTISATAATDSLNNRPQMAELQNGNVVVTWSSGPFPNSQQKFSIRAPSGLPVLAETDVNPEDALHEDVNGDVVALADGNFVVIFTRTADVNDIKGRLFDQDGNALGVRFDISAGNGIIPAATALQDGRFMVVFDTAVNIFGRVMFADGTPDGAQFAIDNAAGSQGDAAIATLADGRVVVSWRSDELGTNDIFAEIYDPREAGLTQSATNLNDDWVGTAFADTVFLGAGNDTLLAGAGADSVLGEAGNDTLAGEAGADSLFGGGGADTLVGGNGTDSLSGGLGADLFVLDAGEVPAGEGIDGGGGVDTMRLGSSADFRAAAVLAIEVLEFDAGVAAAKSAFLTANQMGPGLAAGATVKGALIGQSDTLAITMGASSAVDLSGLLFQGWDTGGSENDRVKVTGDGSAESVVGSSQMDVVNAFGGNDTLDGRGGLDVLLGGTGDDTYIIDSLLDQTIEAGGLGEGDDTVESAVGGTLQSSIENLALTGGAAINGSGNTQPNTITGNGAANILNGLAAGDTMAGGDGDDTYFVDNGGDVVTEQLNQGTDAVRSSVVATLAANVETLILLAGAGGINGAGNELNNRIDGNESDNVIVGKAGNDLLTGGLGADKFQFDTALSAATNVDTVTDFDVPSDLIRLDDAIFAGLVAGAFLPAGAFHIGAAAADAGDRIVYNNANGDLFFDADGLGGAAQTRFAILDPGLAPTAGDFFVV